MSEFGTLADNPILNAISKELLKQQEEILEENRKKEEERRKELPTRKCCFNCKYLNSYESCFALQEFCDKHGHWISGFSDECVCESFQWKSGKEPKQEDNSMTLDIDGFGHVTIKENKNGSQSRS